MWKGCHQMTFDPRDTISLTVCSMSLIDWIFRGQQSTQLMWGAYLRNISLNLRIESIYELIEGLCLCGATWETAHPIWSWRGHHVVRKCCWDWDSEGLSSSFAELSRRGSLRKAQLLLHEKFQREILLDSLSFRHSHTVGFGKLEVCGWLRLYVVFALLVLRLGFSWGSEEFIIMHLNIII